MSGVVCLCWAPKRVMLCCPSFASVCGHGTTYKHVQCHTQSSTYIFIKKKKLLCPQASAQRLMSHVVPAQAGRRCFVNHREPPGWGCGVLRGVSQAPRDPAGVPTLGPLPAPATRSQSWEEPGCFLCFGRANKAKNPPKILVQCYFFFFFLKKEQWLWYLPELWVTSQTD